MINNNTLTENVQTISVFLIIKKQLSLAKKEFVFSGELNIRFLSFEYSWYRMTNSYPCTSGNN